MSSSSSSSFAIVPTATTTTTTSTATAAAGSGSSTSGGYGSQKQPPPPPLVPKQSSSTVIKSPAYTTTTAVNVNQPHYNNHYQQQQQQSPQPNYFTGFTAGIAATASSAPALWELDVIVPKLSTTSNNPTTATTTSTGFGGIIGGTLQQQSLLLHTWLQTQMISAVSNAMIKIPPPPTAAAAAATAASSSSSSKVLEEEQQLRSNQLVSNVLLTNLLTAVQSLRVTEAKTSAVREGGGRLDPSNRTNDTMDDDDDDDDSDNNDVPTKKRRKLFIAQKKRGLQLLHDPYHVWFQKSPPDTTDTGGSNDDDDDDATNTKQQQQTTTATTTTIWDDEQDDIPIVVGGKLSILSMGGIFNGLSKTFICTTPIIPHSSKLLLQQAVMAGTIQQWKQQQQQSAVGGGGGTYGMTHVTIGHLHMIATSIHSAIAERVKYDIVRTTPTRIQSLLASDLTRMEFQSVRRRLHDTVILGKGVVQQQAQSVSTDDNNDTTLAVGGTTSQQLQQHAIDKFKKCPGCGNNDQSEFILDRKNGDMICANCGIVVSESIMHEGNQFRKFEGEIDRNHHGDASNPLYSNAHNMGTSLSSVMPTTGAGMGGRGSGGNGNSGRRNLETILKNAHAYTELNVSQFGRTDARRTRVGYKDRQKKSAFAQMTHAGDALNLHEAVVQRAKELFAGFRDDRELVQQLKGILAACLCEAFEQLSAEGKHLLRQQQQMSDQQAIGTTSATNRGTSATIGTLEPDNPKAPIMLSVRAARRNDLHHADMAGKGGLLLNTPITSVVANTAVASVISSPTTAAAVESGGGGDDQKPEKLAATWDLEDCRSWLLNASRSIAQAWVDERTNHTQYATATNNNITNIPSGSVDELEGRLVEHAITLCEHLENEIQARATSSSSSIKSSRVTTPRLTDMTKIGIKWQHSHERGSGGKGGVGGSGVTNGNHHHQRTAGQILLLKTSKKLGVLLNDPVAGDAIHRELRNVIGRQEAIKQREMRDEATRQRLHQMQRKPWLAAKAQQ